MIKKLMHTNILIVVIICIICIAIVVSIIYINILFPAPISKSSMENEFMKQKEILLKVAKYLEKQEYSRVYITSTSKRGEMFAARNTDEMGKHIQISDNSIVENISELFEKYNYKVITKNINGIYFQRWSNRHYGRGVVYSTNGETPQNEFITKLEPLTEENWYFYEEK